jgi:hypothetical protein
VTAEKGDESTKLAAERLAAFLDDQFHRIFSVLEQLRPAVVELIENAYKHDKVLELDDLRVLEPKFRSALQSCDRMVKGLSFSSDRGVIAGRPYTVAYWIRRPSGAIVESFPLTDPNFEEHYAYQDFDFFVGAKTGSDQVVSGPYVDYGYDNQYRLTCAVRVDTNRGFVGAVTADVYLDRLESRLEAIARDSRGGIVLANDDDRVVASNRAEHPTGVLVAVAPDWQVVNCSVPGWKVLWRA